MPVRTVLDLARPDHRARVVAAVADGAPMGYWFGNFCVIGARPGRGAFLRVNRGKGRPDSQPGSVVTTPARLWRMFDWSQLPPSLDRAALCHALDVLVGLGPIGVRGPATDTVPEHLSAVDGPVRTVQVVVPGRACPSNVLVDELLDRIGGEMIFGTSANVSKVRTGRPTPTHNTVRAFVAEFESWSDMVFVGPADEDVARARFPLHLPGSTSLLSFHRERFVDGQPAVVLERLGSLASDVIEGVLNAHGLALAVADEARELLPMRPLPAPQGRSSLARSGTGPA